MINLHGSQLKTFDDEGNRKLPQSNLLPLKNFRVQRLISPKLAILCAVYAEACNSFVDSHLIDPSINLLIISSFLILTSCLIFLY